MASLPPGFDIAEALQGTDAFDARDDREGRHSGGDGNRRDLEPGGQAPALGFTTLQRQGDRVADVGESLLPRAALGDAAWDEGTLGDDEAIFARAQDHGKVTHGTILRPTDDVLPTEASLCACKTHQEFTNLVAAGPPGGPDSATPPRP